MKRRESYEYFMLQHIVFIRFFCLIGDTFIGRFYYAALGENMTEIQKLFIMIFNKVIWKFFVEREVALVYNKQVGKRHQIKTSQGSEYEI